MTLKEFLKKYINEHQLKPGTCTLYSCTVNQFERMVGSSLMIQDLQADHVNHYLSALAAIGRAAETLKGRKRAILTIWRYAREQRMNTNPDDCVRRLRSEETLVEVWSVGEVRQLLEAAKDRIGKRSFPNGMDEGRYWAAYVPAAWESGLRRGCMWALPHNKISQRFWWRQIKTGTYTLVELRPATIKLIDGIMEVGPRRSKPFIPPCHPKTWCDRANDLIREAGLTGTMKYLRRGCCTDVSQAAGNSEAGSKKLGHKSTAVTEKHYLPPDWQERPTLLPEEL